MDEFFAVICAEHQRWLKGELYSHAAHALIAMLSDFATLSDPWLAAKKLTFEQCPSDLALGRSILRLLDQRIEVCRIKSAMYGRIQAQTAEKNAAIKWGFGPAVTNDWFIPQAEGFRLWCCSCNASHILDSRIKDEAIELRVFNDYGDNDHANENGDREAEGGNGASKALNGHGADEVGRSDRNAKS